MVQHVRIAILIGLAIPACFGSRNSDEPMTTALWEKPVHAVVFELDYFESAVPLVAPLASGLHPFHVAGRNARRLLRSSVSGEVRMPTRLDQMGVIPESLARTSYTDADIATISERTLETPASRETRVFFYTRLSPGDTLSYFFFSTGDIPLQEHDRRQ